MDYGPAGCQMGGSGQPVLVRREMVVGPPAGGKKKRKKPKKTRGRRGRRKAGRRLPRIEGAFLGSVAIDDNPGKRLLARREQRNVIEANRPWRQPMQPMVKRQRMLSGTLSVGAVRGGFGSSAVRKVVLPTPQPPPSSQPQPLPPPVSVRTKRHKPTPPKAMKAQRTAPMRYRQPSQGLPYMKNIKQIMTAKKLMAKVKELNTLARKHFADSDIRVANAWAAARSATEAAEKLELAMGQRLTELEAAQNDLLREEMEARQAQHRLSKEVADAEAAESAASKEVQEAKDAEAHAAEAELEARATAAEALRQKNLAVDAQASAAAAAEKAARKEEEAARAQEEQVVAERALAEAEQLVERGVNPGTGKKLKKQEKREAVADLVAKREKLLHRAPSARISDQQTQLNEARLREAEEELAGTTSKKLRKVLVSVVAQQKLGLQKERSAGVRRALEAAAQARVKAEAEAKAARVALQVADTARATADREAAAAASARELANAQLEEMRTAQSAAAVEREEAAAAALAVNEEAEDVARARITLDSMVAAHTNAQTIFLEAKHEALRLTQAAEDRAAQSAVIPPPSVFDQDPDHHAHEDAESTQQYDHFVEGHQTVAEMRPFVVELLDRSLEQLCLPEVGPLEFATVKEPLRRCLDTCQEAINLLAFDANVEHPAWSNQIDKARTEFVRLRTVCCQKMINGLLLLANQQLADPLSNYAALKDCRSSCDEALSLCADDGSCETIRVAGGRAVALSTSHSGSARLARFWAQRRAQIERCRRLAQQKSRAVELRDNGREILWDKDVHAVTALEEAVVLDPEDGESARLCDEPGAFACEKSQGVEEKAAVSHDHEKAAQNQETAMPAAKHERVVPNRACGQGAIQSAASVDAASKAAGGAAGQATSSGLADTSCTARQEAMEQQLQNTAQEQNNYSGQEQPDRKEANMIKAMSDYKHQVSTLKDALRQHAEDAQKALVFVANTTAQVEALQAEAEEREAAFAEERQTLETQISRSREETARSHEEIRRLERELEVAQAAAEYAVDSIRDDTSTLKRKDQSEVIDSQGRQTDQMETGWIGHTSDQPCDGGRGSEVPRHSVGT